MHHVLAEITMLKIDEITDVKSTDDSLNPHEAVLGSQEAHLLKERVFKGFSKGAKVWLNPKL
ncbi:hypothetical protein Taro_028703 [Colocasia esculenta]|uniref:Uncharacterized protein n=1 Tax=Colocasia esculenta TaxID=4460 RepID=A0A843VJA8_COLES|nr:hypothetical protein [Colocasia esculenta]